LTFETVKQVAIYTSIIMHE